MAMEHSDLASPMIRSVSSGRFCKIEKKIVEHIGTQYFSVHQPFLLVKIKTNDINILAFANALHKTNY